MTAAKTKSAPLASHVAPDGSTRMVDVSAKQASLHEATAAARVRVGRAIASAIRGGAIPKGPVLETARLAGIMAAKLTPSLIPLRHPPPLEHVGREPALKDDAVEIVATARATHRTGVEMEALTAVAVCTGKRKGVQKRPHPAGTRWTLPARRWSGPGGPPATRAPIGSNRPPGEVWIQ